MRRRWRSRAHRAIDDDKLGPRQIAILDVPPPQRKQDDRLLRSPPSPRLSAEGRHFDAWRGAVRPSIRAAPYDDVVYFVDGLERMRVFFDQGLHGLAANLIAVPPHAPYSTLAAMLAFLLGGASAAGPYFVNAIVMAFLAAVLFRLLRVGGLTTWCLALLIISLPWFDSAVTIFHPDLVAGFAVAIMAVAFIWQDEIIETRRCALLIGVGAGSILLIKPTAFGMVVGLWGVSFLVGAFISYHRARSFPVIRTLYLAVPILIIAGPYFAHELPGIVAYIHQGWVREYETWVPDLLHLDKMFYIKLARSIFEYWFWVAVIGPPALLVASALCRDSTNSMRFAGLIVITLTAYIVPTSVEFKHYHWGGIFYGCIAVCLILTLHYIADRCHLSIVRQPVQPFGFSFRVPQIPQLILLAVAGLALADAGDKQGRFPPVVQRAALAEYDAVYDILRGIARQEFINNAGNVPPLMVYAPCPAPVAPHAYRFRGLLEGLDIQVNTSPHDKDLAALLDVASRAGILVLPDDDALKFIYPYPVNKVIPAMRTWLADSKRFTKMGIVRTSLGTAEIFVNASLITTAAADAAQGL